MGITGGINEIVAFKIGERITNNPAVIRVALESGQEFELLNRAHMRLMAMMDLGPEWTALANAPTLFTMDQLEEA